MNVRTARPVLILTVADLEYQAVRNHLTGLRKHLHPAGTPFESGRLPSGGEVIIGSTGEGSFKAAVLAERAMNTFSPQALLFVGVAGALKSDIDLGDVVVATKIHSYHGGKEEDGGFMARPSAWPAPHELLEPAHRIARTESWAQHLMPRLPGRLPEVHFKPIAAGDVLLNSRGTPTAEQLRRVFNDAVAIEMGSAGISQASQFNRCLPALIIRGISDRADGGKSVLDRAGWQPIAAAHAAAFAAALATDLISEGQNTPDHPAPEQERISLREVLESPWPPDGW